MRCSPLNVLVALVCAMVASTTGCSADVVPAGADATAFSTHALLVVEQSLGAGQSEAARTHASVVFLRLTDDQSLESALHLVTDVPELPAVGQCASVGPRAAQDLDMGTAPVELAFAGDVAVETSASRVPLAVRAFPDVAGVVSGVVYTVREQQDFGFQNDSTLEVRASGAPDFAPVSASASAPSPLRSVSINGQPWTGEDLQISRSEGLNLQWNSGTSSDLLYVDITPIPGSIYDRVRCVLADTGSGTIPVLAVPETPAMEMSVHRVRDVSLRSGSDDVGVAHFDLSVSTRVTIAAP